MRRNCWTLSSHSTGPPPLDLSPVLHVLLAEAWPQLPGLTTVPLPGHTWRLLPFLPTLSHLSDPTTSKCQQHPDSTQVPDCPPPATNASRACLPPCRLQFPLPTWPTSPASLTPAPQQAQICLLFVSSMGPPLRTAPPLVSSFCLGSAPRLVLPAALIPAGPSASLASSLLHLATRPPHGSCLLPGILSVASETCCSHCVPSTGTQCLCVE